MDNPKSVRFLIPILSASNFVIGMGAFVVIGLIEPMAADFGMTTAGAGWILTSYALGYAVLSPLLVSLTGKVGRRKVLAAGLGIFAIAGFLSAIAPNAALLNVARIVAAAGAGMFSPVAAAVGAELSARERRGRALAAVFFGLTLAQVFGVPAGSFIAYTFGWRAAFLIVALLALPCLFLIWTQIPKGLQFQTVLLTDLGRTLRNFPVMLAVLFTSSIIAASFAVYTYLSPLLSETMGYQRDGITLILLICGLGAVGGNVIGGILADRVSAVVALCGLALCQAALLPLFSGLPVGDVALFSLAFIWSLVGWSFMPSQQVRLMQIAPENISVVFALNAAAIYVGAAVGSAIGSGVITIWGLSGLGIVAGLLALAAVGHILLSRKVSGV